MYDFSLKGFVTNSLESEKKLLAQYSNNSSEFTQVKSPEKSYLQNVHGHGDCFYLAAVLQLIYSVPAPTNLKSLEVRIKSILDAFFDKYDKGKTYFKSVITACKINSGKFLPKSENALSFEDFLEEDTLLEYSEGNYANFIRFLAEDIQRYNSEDINCFSSSALEDYPRFDCLISIIRHHLVNYLQSSTQNIENKINLERRLIL